jgi:hypothetical protein
MMLSCPCPRYTFNTASPNIDFLKLRRKLGTLHAAPIPARESETYSSLHSELVRRGIVTFRFARVTGPYYEMPLEFRAQRVAADSIQHLCKTMIMENTRALVDTAATADPRVSKVYMVLVQYCATIDAEKLRSFIHKACHRVTLPPVCLFLQLPCCSALVTMRSLQRARTDPE